MKLSFESYVLVSFVTLAHVVALAVMVPAGRSTGAPRYASADFVDEDGLAWMGPLAPSAAVRSDEPGEEPDRAEGAAETDDGEAVPRAWRELRPLAPASVN